MHYAARDAIGLIHSIVSGTVPSTSILFAIKGFDDIRNLDLSHMPQSDRNDLYRDYPDPCRPNRRSYRSLASVDKALSQRYSKLSRLCTFTTTRYIRPSVHYHKIIDNIISPCFRAIGMTRRWGHPLLTLDHWRVRLDSISTRLALSLCCKVPH